VVLGHFVKTDALLLQCSEEEKYKSVSDRCLTVDPKQSISSKIPFKNNPKFSLSDIRVKHIFK
jgi:hypothetical protein